MRYRGMRGRARYGRAALMKAGQFFLPLLLHRRPRYATRQSHNRRDNNADNKADNNDSNSNKPNNLAVYFCY